jgi:hypothetical protein
MGKTYELWLHYKQGDDFAAILEKEPTPSKALESWAAHFAACRDICAQLARTLAGKNVEAGGGTHYIGFTAKDDEAERALAALAKENLLRESLVETPDEDDE